MILGGGVAVWLRMAVCLLLSAHRAVIFAIAQFFCFTCVPPCRLGGGVFSDTYVARWKGRRVAAKRIAVGLHQSEIRPYNCAWIVDNVAFLRYTPIVHHQPCHIYLVTYLHLRYFLPPLSHSSLVYLSSPATFHSV